MHRVVEVRVEAVIMDGGRAAAGLHPLQRELVRHADETSDRMHLNSDRGGTDLEGGRWDAHRTTELWSELVALLAAPTQPRPLLAALREVVEGEQPDGNSTESRPHRWPWRRATGGSSLLVSSQ